MRFFLTFGVLALVGALLSPPPVAGQVARVRGTVVDEEGNPLPGVTIELRYVGEGRPRTYTIKTDKNGGYVRVGMPGGPYKIDFKKEGYQPHGIDTNLSFGDLSEIPPITLFKATAQPVAPPSAQDELTAEQQAAAAEAAEKARLGAAYAEAVDALQAGRLDEAETLLKEVAAGMPDEPLVHFNLGYLYRQRKDLAAAEAEYRRTIELEPARSDAYIALAVVLEGAGRGGEALELLQGAASAFDRDAAFQTALGATAMNAGRTLEAEKALAKAAALDPSNAEIQFHLASLAVGRGEVDDAVSHLEAYLRGAAPGAPNVEVAKQLLEALKARED